MIDDFVDRKHGRKKVEYELPELQEILQETLGVIVYQEQVMQIADRRAHDFKVRMAEKSRNPAERPGVLDDAQRLQGGEGDQRPGVEDVGAKDVERTRIPAERAEDFVRGQDGVFVQFAG